MTERVELLLVSTIKNKVRIRGKLTLIRPDNWPWGDALHLNDKTPVTAVYCKYNGKRALDVTHWTVAEIFTYRNAFISIEEKPKILPYQVG